MNKQAEPVALTRGGDMAPTACNKALQQGKIEHASSPNIE
jgi:hypothetical protein